MNKLFFALIRWIDKEEEKINKSHDNFIKNVGNKFSSKILILIIKDKCIN